MVEPHADADPSAMPACPRCGYVLVSISSPRCPECGIAISAADFADRSRLIPALPWEKRAYIGRVGAFFATAFAFLIRPRRTLALIRPGETVHAAIAYWCWLIPAAWMMAVVLFAPVYVYDHWKWLNRVEAVDVFFIVGVRCAALILTAVLLWLPALVALDFVLWRQRRAFHAISRFVMYTATWWFWAAVFFSGLGDWAIRFAVVSTPLREWLDRLNVSRLSPYLGWCWGQPPLHGGLGGGLPAQWVPWICWVASALFTLQAVAVGRFVQRAKLDENSGGSLSRRLAVPVLALGWLIAVHLLVWDRHIQLRFHLQFAINEIEWLYEWANSLFEGRFR